MSCKSVCDAYYCPGCLRGTPSRCLRCYRHPHHHHDHLHPSPPPHPHQPAKQQSTTFIHLLMNHFLLSINSDLNTNYRTIVTLRIEIHFMCFYFVLEIKQKL